MSLIQRVGGRRSIGEAIRYPSAWRVFSALEG